MAEGADVRPIRGGHAATGPLEGLEPPPRREEEGVGLAVLVLVEDDPEAQRMVVTWPLVWGRFRGDGDPTEEALAYWESVSLVDREELGKRLVALRANGILREEGRIHPEVLKLIRGRVAARIAGKMKR